MRGLPRRGTEVAAWSAPVDGNLCSIVPEMISLCCDISCAMPMDEVCVRSCDVQCEWVCADMLGLIHWTVVP